MTTRIPNAVGVWHEIPEAGASVALSRMYWAYDAATFTWTLTTNPVLEAGKFVDLGGTGTFTLELLGAVPSGRTTLAQTRRADGTVLSY